VERKVKRGREEGEKKGQERQKESEECHMSCSKFKSSEVCLSEIKLQKIVCA